MLYSLLVAVLILSFFNALVIPFMVVKYFIKGYNIHAETPISEPKVPLPKKKPSEHRFTKILRNVDNYTGDETGQVPIE